MKKIPLLPRYFRWIGLFLVFISFLVYLNGILNFLPLSSMDIYVKTFNLINQSHIKGGEDFHFGLHNVNLGFLLIIIPSLIGLAILSFCKSKVIEDEFVSSIRLFSWTLSIVFFILYSLLIAIFTAETIYLSFTVVSPHFMLIMFIILFQLQLYKMNRRLANEE